MKQQTTQCNVKTLYEQWTEKFVVKVLLSNKGQRSTLNSNRLQSWIPSSITISNNIIIQYWRTLARDYLVYKTLYLISYPMLIFVHTIPMSYLFAGIKLGTTSIFCPKTLTSSLVKETRCWHRILTLLSLIYYFWASKLITYQIFLFPTI